MKVKLCTALFALILLSSCTTIMPTYVWNFDPIQQKVSNEYFDAEIFPIIDDQKFSWQERGYNSFRLSLTNKSDKDIEVDWNKTLFISQGQTSGGFMFEGVVYSTRNNPKPPDVVFAHSSMSKIIYPNALVFYSSNVGSLTGINYGGWNHAYMGSGENGIYLSVIVEGKEIKEKLTVNLSKK